MRIISCRHLCLAESEINHVVLLHCCCVTHPHFGGMVRDKTCATHDLNSIGGGKFCQFDGLILCGLGFLYQRCQRTSFVPVPTCRGTPCEQTHGVKFHRHLGNDEGDTLIRGNGTPKGDALTCIVACIFERGTSDTTGDGGTQNLIECGGANDSAIPRFA